MTIIRGAHLSANVEGESVVPDRVPEVDPLAGQAGQVFADELEAGRISSIRVIRSHLHVGQPRAQQIRAYLAALAHG
jgi:hypothetical protein